MQTSYAPPAASPTSPTTTGTHVGSVFANAEIGEELILVSYDPFTGASPYRSASPIFLHRSRCTPSESADIPGQLARRTLSVRAFDSTEMMIDAALTDGADLSATIHRLLADAEVHHLHVHNEPRGCWAARVDRA